VRCARRKFVLELSRDEDGRFACARYLNWTCTGRPAPEEGSAEGRRRGGEWGALSTTSTKPF
jgi:hypothetical protein